MTSPMFSRYWRRNLVMLAIGLSIILVAGNWERVVEWWGW